MNKLMIYRRPTPSGRHTYWMDGPDGVGLIRVRRATALKMVDVGKARLGFIPQRA